MSTLSQFFSNSADILAETLVAGGGGAGGAGRAIGFSGGGGGAGQLIYRAGVSFAKGTTYQITVGAGGSGVLNTLGTSGSASAIGTFLAEGGGGGGCASAGLPGGGVAPLGCSGGGSGSTAGAAPIGLQYSVGFLVESSSLVLANQGLNSTSNTIGGRGGGALSSGAGASIVITGSSASYCAGGAGGNGTAGTPGSAGAVNTGSGGGGSQADADNPGGNGGSGIVVIAYPDTYTAPAAITGTYTTPTRTGYRVYRFTGSGSITF